MGHEKNIALGRLGVLGICLTAGFAVPFVNVLREFAPEQLMVFRGFLTALMTVVVMRKIPWRVDRNTYLIALVLPFATLGLFEGIRAWGAGPTIVILTATPFVTFALSPFLGRKISSASVVGLVLLLGGVAIARWGGEFQWAGFGWSVFATVMNGILYELFARSKAGRMETCFWFCIGMGTLGLVLSTHDSWAAAADPRLLIFLVGFAFVGGFLYSLANLLTFENLSTNEASVLAQGETPAVILGAALLLGEHLTPVQWLGVALALYGAWHLSRWLKKQDAEP
ncbi:MAG: EamA family transporter [Patescibacteria group bacterium]